MHEDNDRATHHPALVRLRAICLALPAATEQLSHGMPAFRVADTRMFAYFWHDHHGDGLTAACVKTGGQEEQAFLLDADPVLYRRLPYLGPSGWIGMNLADPATDWAHIAERVRLSHALVAPRPSRRTPAGRRSAGPSR